MSDDTNLNINIGADPSGIQSGASKAKVAIKTVTKESTDLDAAFRRLKSAIDPTFAATEKYNKELAETKSLLDSGRISQEEYAAGVRAAKAALDAQLTSIEKNSSATKAAAAAAKQAAAEEIASRAEVASAAAAAAQQTAAAARKATQDLKRENQLRRIDEKTQIDQVVAAARAAAIARVAAERQAAVAANQAPATKSNDRAAINAAVAAARAGAQAIAAASKQADIEELASAIQVAEEKKRLAQEASAVAVQATRERVAAEAEANAAAMAADQAYRAEAIKAARDATKLATQASKDNARAKKEEAAALKEAARAAAEQAKAEKQAADAANQMRASIDPSFAAQLRYNQTMEKATELLNTNKLTQEEWIAIQKQAKAQMDLNARSMGRMNQLNVQMGYQMQDVVASWASGINPLVILAQQGGQTASAMSMMGGTVGRVAAFFAGPWGAAIIGATLLLGIFLGTSKKSKDAEIDLMKAEDLHRASLDKLTEAVKKYNEAAKKKNENDAEAHQNALTGARDAESETTQRMASIKSQIDDLKAQQKFLTEHPQPGQGGALAAVNLELSIMESKLKAIAGANADANNAEYEYHYADAIRNAEDAVDGAQAARHKYEATLASIHEKYSRLAQTAQNWAAMEREIAAALQKKTDEEKAWQAAKKANSTDNETREFGMPVNGRITSGFGHRTPVRTLNGNMSSENHAGIDIAAPRGTPVKAPQVGVVEAVGFSPTLGKYVVINHGAGTTTRFGHMDDVSVQKGESVSAGQKIGNVGSTGNATGPHLHYEIRINGKAVDPTKQHILPIDQLKADEEVAKNSFEAQIAAYDRDIAAADDNYKLAVEIQKKKIAATEAYYGTGSKEAEEAAKQLIEIEHKLQDQLFKQHQKGIQAREQADEAHEKAANDKNKTTQGMAGDVTEYKASTGQISEKQAAIAHAAALEQEYQEQVRHEEAMYQLKHQSLLDQLALEDLPVQQQIELNAKKEELEAQHQERMDEIRNQHTRDAARAQLDVQSVTMNRMRGVVQTFTGSLSSAFQGLWTHSISVKQALLNIADSLTYKFVDMGLEILERWIMTQLGMKVATAASETAQVGIVAASQAAQTGVVVAGTTARTAAEVAGAATSKSITLSTALMDIGAAAARGAAHTYASIAAIPVVGPFLAPAMAVAALGAILAFGSKIFSAEGGWGEVDKDGRTTQLHRKEMVLPAKYAEPLRKNLTARTSSGIFAASASAGSSMANSNTRGGDVNFKYSPTHNYRNMDAETMLQRDGATFRKWIKNQIRNGDLKVG
jgi:murein DD-endopeptidase MepM/ murein hydrolase activator NlpD